MKIGRFSETNKLSIDTIRHYMDLNLIVPSKNGAQYEFDEVCQKDLEDILIFKSMGFELKEIKAIFYYKRLANLTPYEEDEYYKEIFKNKHDYICREISKLSSNRSILEEKISELSIKSTGTRRKLGIDINMLSKLCCVKCKGNLLLKDGTVEDNQVINGQLRCKCGEGYLIDDGILIVKNDNSIESQEINYKKIIDYINNTSSIYLDGMYKGHELMYKNVSIKEYTDKIILELGSGLGFSLRMMYKDIPDTATYIAVDHNLNSHKFLKSTIEKAEQRKNIIFICCDFLDIPLKDNSVDILFDFSGSSNYGFTNKEFLLNSLDRYIRKDSELIGSYIIFKNFLKDSYVRGTYRDNFNLDFVKNKINNLGYKKKYELISEEIEEGGRYESYFKKGEKVYFYIFYGKR